MASTETRNEAFDFSKDRVLKLVKKFVPGFFQNQANEEINEHTADLLELVDGVIAIVEKNAKHP